LLGYEVAELTVAKYMHRTSLRPSPTWRAYLAYYNPPVRSHQALANNSPQPREVQAPSPGRITTIPHVGGLHHRYQRVA